MLKACLLYSFRIARADYLQNHLCWHVVCQPGAEESIWKWTLMESEVMFWDRGIV